MAKDFLGKPLFDGDKVVFMKKNYRSLSRGIVTKVTDKMVIVACKGETIRQFHDQVVKI